MKADRQTLFHCQPQTDIVFTPAIFNNRFICVPLIGILSPEAALAGYAYHRTMESKLVHQLLIDV
jgi:hypothetical protein